MKLFKKLIAALFTEPKKCNDPVLGELVFHAKSAEWASESDHTFGSDKAQIIVAAGENGPTEHQRQMYIEFRNRWEDTRRTMQPLAFDELKAQFDGTREWYAKNGDSYTAEMAPILTSEDEVW